MTKIQQKAQNAVESLHKSVSDTLDEKRRLGQYAVIWRDDKVVRLFAKEDSSKKRE
jgi:hypothetical protein